jgi:hypothetical protein
MAEYQLHTKNIWFPNQTEPVYDPQDEEAMLVFRYYWRQEKDRCINGFYIADGQLFIPGRLYSHTVYGKIAAYVEREVKGKVVKSRQIITPILRDIDWDIIAVDLEACTEQGLFYDLVGSRDFGKSVIAALCAWHLYTFSDKSESVISGGASSYIKLVTDKIEDTLLNIHPMFRKQRITSDWKKEIVAGWKDKSTQLADPASSFSSIKVRNYENGNKTMAANGTRPGFHLIDEIGTIPNLIGCIKDSDGCWWSGGGDKPSCLVFRTGTGGDMEVGKEAGEVFFKPEAYNGLAFDNPEVPGTKMGRFISALRAKMAYKEPWTLFRYLTEKLHMELTPHPDLDVTILVSDEERALEQWWKPEYLKALKSGNSKTVLKFKAYWPLKASDSFLVLTKNDYNIEAAKLQQQRLRAYSVTGSLVELYHNGEGITHKPSNKLPITEFPVKTQSKDAPIQVWEFPIDDMPPFGLYVAGVDNYRQGKAEYSDSLGVVYIFKRMHDIHSEKYQDMLVAAYAARPESPEKWNEQARMLIKWYNARTLCENDDMTFINYMISKGDGHYLEDQPQWLKLYVPNTTVDRDKGIHRSSEKVRDMLRAGSKKYFDDIIKQEKDEDGSVIKEVLGVSRIPDPMLLEEVINFNEEEGNYDREVAFSLAIALANHLDPIIGKVGGEGDPRINSLFKKPIKGNKLFTFQSKMFKPKTRKLFSR